MSNKLVSKKTLSIELRGNLTKTELVSQINSVTDFIKQHLNKLVEEIMLDFNSIVKIDTYALVFIIQVERFCRFNNSKKLNIIWKNIPNNLDSFIKLSSLSGHLDIR